jgi:hypothetical protein
MYPFRGISDPLDTKEDDHIRGACMYVTQCSPKIESRKVKSRLYMPKLEGSYVELIKTRARHAMGLTWVPHMHTRQSLPARAGLLEGMGGKMS